MPGPVDPGGDGAISIPADHWRWRVADWVGCRWRKWHELSIKLTPPDATAEQIRDSHRRAFAMLMNGDDAFEFEDVDDGDEEASP